MTCTHTIVKLPLLRVETAKETISDGDEMITNHELKTLVDRARAVGAIIRTKLENDWIVGVSIGMVPGGKYRRLGDRGAGWMPPIAAAERLREIIAKSENAANAFAECANGL